MMIYGLEKEINRDEWKHIRFYLTYDLALNELSKLEGVHRIEKIWVNE